MRIGIFSDVHGNLEALEVVLKALEHEKVDRTICLGDLVGYGPNPNQCIKKVMELADVVVAGNHDHAAIGLISTTQFNEYAKIAIDWTREVLNSISINCLFDLPLIKIEGEITMVHATPEAPSEWHYLFTFEDIDQSFSSLTTPLCFVGHSHGPCIFVKDEGGKIFLHNTSELVIEPMKKYIINVGSVGQPRDGDPRATYSVLDIDNARFQLKRLFYPVDQVQEKMRNEGLPQYLIYRLEVGL